MAPPLNRMGQPSGYKFTKQSSRNIQFRPQLNKNHPNQTTMQLLHTNSDGDVEEDYEYPNCDTMLNPNNVEHDYEEPEEAEMTEEQARNSDIQIPVNLENNRMDESGDDKHDYDSPEEEEETKGEYQNSDNDIYELPDGAASGNESPQYCEPMEELNTKYIDSSREDCLARSPGITRHRDLKLLADHSRNDTDVDSEGYEFPDPTELCDTDKDYVIPDNGGSHCGDKDSYEHPPSGDLPYGWLATGKEERWGQSLPHRTKSSTRVLKPNKSFKEELPPIPHYLCQKSPSPVQFNKDIRKFLENQTQINVSRKPTLSPSNWGKQCAVYPPSSAVYNAPSDLPSSSSHVTFDFTMKRVQHDHTEVVPTESVMTKHRSSRNPTSRLTHDLERNFKTLTPEDRTFSSSGSSTPTAEKSRPKTPHRRRLQIYKCDRNAATAAVKATKQNGAYLLRESSRQESSQPYTLVVYHENEVYNVPVRCLEPEGKYALGMEKAGEELFDSLEEITEYFRYKPLFLIGRKQNEGKPTYLGFPAQL
uniref:B-cell linker protein-like isoform X2 n=1 Tax=Myxine glutinosa TaxID=7769 RepID=UPI00358FF38F